ncbi:MAG: TPM domain-containing protein [Planctomycetota bacterium]|nr:TPM domain-containing protein [Planctomycetota bacterium]
MLTRARTGTGAALLLAAGVALAPSFAGAEEGAKTPKAGEGKDATGLFRLDRYVYDTTGTLTPLEADRIQLQCEDFHQRSQCPIAVVVLNRLAETGDRSGDAITTAKALMEQLCVNRKNPDLGLLMLVALEDGQVAIWMGGDWGSNYGMLVDELIQKVMIKRLSSKDDQGEPKKRDVSGAILEALTELMPALLRQRDRSGPVIWKSAAAFLQQSWIWMLLVLHLLGFVYVLSTKEDTGWYLAGLCFGLAIFLGMFLLVLHGGEDQAGGGGLEHAQGLDLPPPPRPEERAVALGHW